MRSRTAVEVAPGLYVARRSTSIFLSRLDPVSIQQRALAAAYADVLGPKKETVRCDLQGPIVTGVTGGD